VDGTESVAASIARRAKDAARPIVVGIAGAVSAGKSTFAAALGVQVGAHGLRVEVMSTDGFLFPNAVLVARGLLAHKGFPESYDVVALRRLVAEARAGMTGLRVPRYSHETYDVERDEWDMLTPSDVVVLEGVNAIGAIRDLVDLGIYLEAAEADLERWYVTRFLELVEEGRHDPSSFYASMAALSDDDVERLAHSTWVGINLVNLRDHIAPTRALADIVVVKGPDHGIVDVREAAGMPTDHDTELVDLLEHVWGSMAELGPQLDEAEWKRATEVPGWSVQDNLTHISSIEARLLGRPDPDHELPDELPHVKNDFGRSNELYVDSRRTLSGADAFAEFREITAERIAQLRAYGHDDFGAETWTPVGPGTVRDLLPFRVFDSWVHEQDMRRAVARPGDLDTPVARVALERIVSSMPFVVGKKAGAPDGSTVVFDLTGPLARTVAIGVDDGRAKLLDASPAQPTVTLSTDTETFARLGCGRVDPGEALGAGAVRIDGDAALGRRVVESMNFLF